jgi:hypothetical protein
MMFRLALFIIAIVAIVTEADCQEQYSLQNPISGTPYKVRELNNVEGTPFLFNEWLDGRVVLKNGSVYKDLKLKFDLYNNKVFYNNNDTMYQFIDPVVEFRLVNPKGDSKSKELVFSFVPAKAEKNSFAQVLAKGKTSLVKFQSKAVEEASEYGTASKTRFFVTKTSTYFVTGEKVEPARYSSDVLEQLTNDKAPQMRKFLKENKLNLKKEVDFITALTYYNSLF